MNRWYTNAGVTLIDAMVAKDAGFNVSKMPEKGTAYYQYCYVYTLEQGEKFSAKMYTDATKRHQIEMRSLYQVVQGIYFQFGGQAKYAPPKKTQEVVYGLIGGAPAPPVDTGNVFNSPNFMAFLSTAHADGSVMLTERFHVSPGKVEVDQGGVVLQQVIVAITTKTNQNFVAFLNKEQPAWKLAAGKATAPGTLPHIENKIFHMDFQENMKGLEKLRTHMLAMRDKNKLLKKSYGYDFGVLASQLASFHRLLGEQYALRILKTEYYGGLVTGAINKVTKGDPEVKKYLMQYSFAQSFEKSAEGEITNVKVVFAEPPLLFLNKDVIFTLDARLFPSLFGEIDSTSMPIFSVDFISILYNFSAILNFFDTPHTSKKTTQVDEFANKFLVPVPPLLPPRKQATKVYNNADAPVKHKSGREVAQEQLTELTKLEVFREVQDKYNQIGDQAFIQVLKDYKKIKTPEDVFHLVLDIIPLDTLMEEATACLLKQLPNTNIKKMVCDTILGDLTMDDVDKILDYLNELSQPVGDKIDQHKTLTQKEKEEYKKYVTIDKAQFKRTEIDRVKKELVKFVGENKSLGLSEKSKSSIIAYANNDLEARDVLCAAILAVVPAALYLLSKLGGKIGDVGDLWDKVPSVKLVNPAKELLDEMEKMWDALGDKITTLTNDWPKMLETLLYGFISTFIVKAIQVVLEEIAQMCEGSDESDFAGMGELPGEEGPPPTLDITFPFVPFAIRDLVNASSTEDPYGDLANNLGVTEDLIQDFLDDLSNFLTISEICSLLSTDGDKKFIIDKIWNGILQRYKYAPILKALNNQPKIEQFFYLLSQSVSQAECVKKLENLEKTKKFLSDLCGPSKNEALLRDLQNKATDEALLELLTQKDEMTQNVLKAIANLSDPSRLASKAPPLFCGPGTDQEGGGQQPVFLSQTHPSQEYISGLFTSGLLGTLQVKFEEELQFYKPILSSTAEESAKASAAAANIVGKMYKLDGVEGLDNKDVQDLAQSAGISTKVAPDVVKVLNDLRTSLVTFIQPGYISLNTTDHIDGKDKVRLKMNFKPAIPDGQVENVPGRTLRINFGKKQAYDKTIEGTEKPYEVLVNEVFADPNNGGVDPSNIYEDSIKNKLLLSDLFYSQLIDQIIKEHAEYISEEDLFDKKTFSEFPLEQKNPRCSSILNSPELAEDVKTNATALQCQKKFGAVPSPQEIAEINSYVELAIKIITIQEYLKCLLVFGTFGIDALLPANAAEQKSFFYRYVMGQIGIFLESKAKTWGDILNQFSRQVYAAHQNKTYNETTAEETLDWILSRQFKSVRAVFAQKLKAVGLDKNNSLSTEHSQENLPSLQIIKNLAATNSETGFFAPPPIEGIEFQQKYLQIPKGFYTSNSRLTNGGFFIEYGFDVMPKFQDEEGSVDKINSDLAGLITKADFGAGTVLINGEEVNTPAKLSGLLGAKPGGFSIGRPSSYTFEQLVNYGVGAEAGESGKKKADWLPALGNVGKISLADYETYYNISSETATEVLKAIPPGFGEISDDDKPPFSANAAASLVQMGSGDPAADQLYSKYNFYYSVNVLIPIDSTADKERYTQLWLDTKESKYNNPFLQSALDKKMFVREGKNGSIFLKLPLYEQNVYEADANPTTKTRLDGAKKFYEENVPEYNALLKSASKTAQFNTFHDSIFYKDLLSFLAIVTAEATENRYPALANLFPQTMQLLGGVMSNKIKVTERETNPEFYQQVASGDIETETDEPDFADYSLIVGKILLKAVASLSDPTWVTPWLMPGPLTPLGAVAKLLDDDGDSDDGDTVSSPKDAAEKIKAQQEAGMADSSACDDAKT